ncbi:MAG TPA: outer membrane lipoprotein carrier protein LolA [Chitinophagaceae bacterium]|nr:outer membrane lipoprotein carrier protein LolA [Chitinophagaceae bacterium]
MQKLKTVTITFLFLISYCITTKAQPSLGKNDPAAKKILDAVSITFKTFKGVQANYTFKVQNKKGEKQGEKTGLVYMKGAKYKIVDKVLQIFCNGKTTWRYDAEAKEVTVSAVDESTQALTPQKLFTNFYDKDFLYKLNGVKSNMAEIQLTPTDKRVKYHTVYLYVNKNNNTITSAKVLETAGNIYLYSISNMKTNVNLKDEDFTFDKKKYPGVEEITQ